MTFTGHVAEEFSEEELAILTQFFTNTDRPVFALQNLDPVVAAALFARYSRTPKSLRRLFLDEFYTEEFGLTESHSASMAGVARAEQLMERVFFEYGDDSVAQLGGAHLACEQASNLLTKILEWGRLMSYLEQSTRYIPYTDKVNGRYRYYRDPAIMAHPELEEMYVEVMDFTFDSYSRMFEALLPTVREMYPRGEQELGPWNASVRSKALDNLRGLLPAATVSNLGIFGTGQSYEQLLLRMQLHDLPEARDYSVMMLQELRKVIPQFLRRVDLPDRGVAWSAYMLENREAVTRVAEELLRDLELAPTTQEVTLLDYDPEWEDKLVAAILAERTHFSEVQLRQRVALMTTDEKSAVLQAYCGDRSVNRRHRPGRHLEIPGYTFEVLSDYGAFRDLQRHRMLTMTWQTLTPQHGFDVPPLVEYSGLGEQYATALGLQAGLFEALARVFPMDAQPQYALGFAYRMRYRFEINARALMHMLELRTQPAGHDDYRRICQEMHNLMRSAGHGAIADMMMHVDHNRYDLGRIQAEQRLAERRQPQASDDLSGSSS